MDKKLHNIQQKIGAIQLGLLRFRDKKSQVAWLVKTTANGDNSLNCVITDDSPKRKLLNKNVKLIQKSHEDYLYITGRVSEEVNKKSKILSIHILKACWFVRRSKGSVSWLKEKYIYERLPGEQMELAS
jgi:hypothetical protein